MFLDARDGRRPIAVVGRMWSAIDELIEGVFAPGRGKDTNTHEIIGGNLHPVSGSYEDGSPAMTKAKNLTKHAVMSFHWEARSCHL
jgi:hypothetical protein